MRKEYRKDSFEFNMFMDLWGIIKEYGIVEQEDAYWISLTNAAREFSKKYGPWAQELVIATMEEFERRLKEQKEVEQ